LRPVGVIAIARGEFLTTCYDSGTIAEFGRRQESAPLQPRQGRNSFVGPNDLRGPSRRHLLHLLRHGTRSEDRRQDLLPRPRRHDHPEATAVHSANGIVVSNDGKRLYAIETEEHRLIQFKIGPDASLSDRGVFLNRDELTHNIGHIYPDGVKIDRGDTLCRPKSA